MASKDLQMHFNNPEFLPKGLCYYSLGLQKKSHLSSFLWPDSFLFLEAGDTGKSQFLESFLWSISVLFFIFLTTSDSQAHKINDLVD